MFRETLTTMKSILAASTTLLALVAAPGVARSEIVFIDLADVRLPAEGAFTIGDGPFQATIHLGIPCEELPPGIWGPPCIAIYGDGFGDADDDGSIDRFAAGDPVGDDTRYTPEALLAGFELIDREDFIWRPVFNDWFDPSGQPMRGFIACTAREQRRDPNYGWIELTVEYDPANTRFDIVAHGFAYEMVPGLPIVAGDRGDRSCPEDLDGDGVVGLTDLSTLLANFGGPGSAADGDISGNGIVGLEDLAAVLAMFGSSCRA